MPRRDYGRDPTVALHAVAAAQWSPPPLFDRRAAVRSVQTPDPAMQPSYAVDWARRGDRLTRILQPAAGRVTWPLRTPIPRPLQSGWATLMISPTATSAGLMGTGAAVSGRPNQPIRRPGVVRQRSASALLMMQARPQPWLATTSADA